MRAINDCFLTSVLLLFRIVGLSCSIVELSTCPGPGSTVNGDITIDIDLIAGLGLRSDSSGLFDERLFEMIQMTNSLMKGLWLLIPLMITVIFVVAPFAFIFLYSFYSATSIDQHSAHAEPWGTLYTDPFYRAVITDTLGNAALTTLICSILGYIPAYFMAMKRLIKHAYAAFIIISPLFVSYIIRTMSWIDIMGMQGLLNQLLMALDIVSSPLHLLYHRWAVVLGLVHFTLPFMILTLYTSLSAIDVDWIDAARSLGCTGWQAFVQITLPLSLPGLASGCLLCFVLASGAYVTPLILGGPSDAMLANVIFETIFIQMNWPLALALSTLWLLFLAVLVALHHRLVSSAPRV